MSHDRGCHCGREPYEYDQCNDQTCAKTSRSFKQPNTSVKYIWERAGSVQPDYVDQDDMIVITQRADYDPDTDRFFQVGNEVHVKITVEIKPKTVYRSGDDTKTPQIADSRQSARVEIDKNLSTYRRVLDSRE
jgi:hypothetical protein